MSKQFLKVADLQLINGGYLSNKEGNPVSNTDFVAAQTRAEYIVTFAEMAKNKDFVGKPADNLESFRKEVQDKLNKSNIIQFVEGPKEVKRSVTDSLANEALAFVEFQSSASKVEKTNKFLQEFAILKEFEDFGLFFEEDIVKLNKLYSMQNVIDAVNEIIELVA